MRCTTVGLGMSVVLVSFSALGLEAQDLEDLCPNPAENTGVLLGSVSDSDSEVALPGATVTATWQGSEGEARAEAQTGLDGGFALCYLPLGVDLSIQAEFATIAGPAITLNLMEPVSRRDLGFSLTGGGDAGDERSDDRIWACFGDASSTINSQNARLIRCEPYWQPLDRCPNEKLGVVTVNRTGVGRQFIREMLEELVTETSRLGANALINITGNMNQIRAEAVKIDVDPSTC